MDGNYSLADIAAATGNGRNNDGMFGGDGAWWLIVLFLFVFCGWGNNGWGNNGNAADIQPQQLPRQISREDLITPQ